MIIVAASILSVAGISFWLAAFDSPATALVAAFFIGFGNGGIAIAIWAAFGDAVARPAGQPGWNFGLLTASIKVGLSAGILGFGLLLDLIGPAISDSRPFVAVMALGPIIGGLCCLIVLMFPREAGSIGRTARLENTGPLPFSDSDRK